MNEERKLPGGQHHIILENRSAMSVSGVLNVDSFDEGSIILMTEMGTLSIIGEELHINRLNVDTGELQIEGSIERLEYSADEVRKGGFFERLFK